MESNHTPATKEKTSKYQLIIFVAAFSAFLATFNETFLNVSFSAIMSDFGVDVGTVQWLATAYMLGAAVMVPVSAFLYRSIKTRPLYITTVGLLIVGSVIAAFSTHFAMLLTGRIIQALGTGMLIPIGMNITLEVAPKQKLGTYMGIMGAMTTLGPSSSVMLAGVLLEFFHWHVLLWFFGGLSFLCLLCGIFLLPNVAKLTYPKLDIGSVVLISISLIGILYGISTLFTGKLTFALLSVLIGVLSLLFFIKRQTQLSDPLIQLQPLKMKPFAIGVILNMISLLVIFAMNIVMPLFMQNGALQLSAFGASMVLFPAILLSCIVSPIAGRIYDKKGGKVLLPLGFLLIGTCTLALGYAQAFSNPILLAILYIPVICGSALIIGPVQSFSLSRLTPEQNPHGVTVMSTGFQIAGCLGSSLFAGVFGLYAAPDSGFQAVCILAAIFALIGLLLAIYIMNSKSKVVNTAPTKQGSLHNIHISDVLETSVYSVSQNASLLEVLQQMAEKKVSGLPIVNEQNQVVGFIADGDIRYIFQNDSNAAGFASMYPLWKNPMKWEEKVRELSQLNVMTCATQKVITVNIDDDIETLFKAFSNKFIKKVPVLKQGKLIGIVSRSDLLRQLITRN